MIARFFKAARSVARSLQILQEIGLIPSHERVQEKRLSCKNVLIGPSLTRDVSREK